MAQHLTAAQIQTVLAKTMSNVKPYELAAIKDALDRVNYVRGTDSGAGALESTLGTILPSTLQP